MRIVALADTHGLHRQIIVPPGDLLIHAGDLTRHGEVDELRDFNVWLGALPHRHKLVIAGNHDRICLTQRSGRTSCLGGNDAGVAVATAR